MITEWKQNTKTKLEEKSHNFKIRFYYTNTIKLNMTTYTSVVSNPGNMYSVSSWNISTKLDAEETPGKHGTSMTAPLVTHYATFYSTGQSHS